MAAHTWIVLEGTVLESCSVPMFTGPQGLPVLVVSCLQPLPCGLEGTANRLGVP